MRMVRLPHVPTISLLLALLSSLCPLLRDSCLPFLVPTPTLYQHVLITATIMPHWLQVLQLTAFGNPRGAEPRDCAGRGQLPLSTVPQSTSPGRGGRLPQCAIHRLRASPQASWPPLQMSTNNHECCPQVISPFPQSPSP